MTQHDDAEQVTAPSEPEPPPEEEAPAVAPLLAALEAEFGDRLDEAARAGVRRRLAELLYSASALAAYPLANADEPGTVFKPLTGE